MKKRCRSCGHLNPIDRCWCAICDSVDLEIVEGIWWQRLDRLTTRLGCVIVCATVAWFTVRVIVS